MILITISSIKPVQINHITTQSKARFEVSFVASPKPGILAALWMNSHDGGHKDTECAFSISRDNGRHWKRERLYRKPGYAVGFDPVVAIGKNGTIYTLCVSGSDADSVIEISSSKDNGRTWTPWFTVGRGIAKAADKPWLAVAHAVSPMFSIVITYRFQILKNGITNYDLRRLLMAEEPGLPKK